MPDPNVSAPAQQPQNLHPQAVEKQDLSESGKEAGLVNAPIVTVAPQSTNVINKSKKREHKLLSGVLDTLHDENEDNSFEYPFGDMKPGQAMFIPTEENKTTDALLAKTRKTVVNLNRQYSEREVDEQGDNILDMVTIERKKRNEDGTVQLDNGVPRVGAASGHMPRLVHYRQYIARGVVKNDEYGNTKVDSDGVIVVRVY